MWVSEVFLATNHLSNFFHPSFNLFFFCEEILKPTAESKTVFFFTLLTCWQRADQLTLSSYINYPPLYLQCWNKNKDFFFVQNQILLSILTLCLCVQVVLSGSQSHSVSVCEFRPQSASVLLHLSGLHRARPVLLHPQMSVLPCELVPQRLCAGTLCVFPSPCWHSATRMVQRQTADWLHRV